MPSLLIVDDEPSIRSLLWLTFVRAGYEVKTAADALKAMELCGSQPFDAILSDVEMPGMDGHCLVRCTTTANPSHDPVTTNTTERLFGRTAEPRPRGALYEWPV